MIKYIWLLLPGKRRPRLRLPPGDDAGAAPRAADSRVRGLHAALHARGAARVARHRVHRVCAAGTLNLTFNHPTADRRVRRLDAALHARVASHRVIHRVRTAGTLPTQELIGVLIRTVQCFLNGQSHDTLALVL